jgi:hypothetical protein
VEIQLTALNSPALNRSRSLSCPRTLGALRLRFDRTRQPGRCDVGGSYFTAVVPIRAHRYIRDMQIYIFAIATCSKVVGLEGRRAGDDLLAYRAP